KDVYGLSLTTQGGPGSLTGVYIRGANPGQTLVLIDGIEMNMPSAPSNSFDFADLPVDNIQRIEILRGPQSTLYGSDALAGVIDIITKKGYGKPKYFLSTEGGSYSTFRAMAGVNGGYKSLNYSVTLSRLQSKGFSSASSKYGNTEKDGTKNINIVSRFGYDFSKNFNLNIFVRYVKAKTDLDQHGGFHGDDPTYIYNLEQQAYKAEGNWKLFNGFWHQKIGISFLKNVRKYSFNPSLYNHASSRSLYDGKRFQLNWQNNFKFNDNNTVIFGFESEKEFTTSNYYYKSNYGVTNSAFPEKDAVTTGIFLQHQLKLGNSFFSSIGVRYDKQSQFGSVVTYKIAPTYIFWKTGTKIRATYGTGFKAPSLFYLYDPSYGNPSLKPEKSYGWDAGIEQYFFDPSLTIGIDYFSNQFDNLFGFNNNYKTININKAQTKGVEVYLKGNPLKRLSFNLNYTYTNAKNTSPSSADKGKALLRRPKNKIGFDLNYDFTNKANANIEIVYAGKRYDKNFYSYPVKRVILGAYTVVNLAGSYSLLKNVKLYGRIENLFNRYYEEVFGYATPGLSAYLGIDLNFGK
ncbi:MAG TPA: TonB-dependent receptor, partial [Ignavibacteria bacterium]|nr:TonB-dependent receptor [Ignavibacteria bacterium]